MTRSITPHAVLRAIRQTPGIKFGFLVKVTGGSVTSLRRRIRDLLAEGKIMRESARYYVANDEPGND